MQGNQKNTTLSSAHPDSGNPHGDVEQGRAANRVRVLAEQTAQPAIKTSAQGPEDWTRRDEVDGVQRETQGPVVGDAHTQLPAFNNVLKAHQERQGQPGQQVVTGKTAVTSLAR